MLLLPGSSRTFVSSPRHEALRRLLAADRDGERDIVPPDLRDLPGAPSCASDCARFRFLELGDAPVRISARIGESVSRRFRFPSIFSPQRVFAPSYWTIQVATFLNRRSISLRTHSAPGTTETQNEARLLPFASSMPAHERFFDFPSLTALWPPCYRIPSFLDDSSSRFPSAAPGHLRFFSTQAAAPSPLLSFAGLLSSRFSSSRRITPAVPDPVASLDGTPALSRLRPLLMSSPSPPNAARSE